MEQLANIISSFLDEPKGGAGDNSQSQYQYCCPLCDETKNSYNLEINFSKGKFHAWCCGETNGMKGNISNLIKRFGTPEILQEYKSAIKEIKASKEYEVDFLNGNGITFEDDEEEKIVFPAGTYDFKFDNSKREENALKYLIERGFDENQIRKYDLKYTTYDCPEKKWNNRIIIPSYNKYNELNYFTGRDYTGFAFQKYMNPGDFKRKELIFNENMISWDATIILCEGVYDSMGLVNAINLMGKSLNKDYYLFECLLKLSTQDIIVFLDNDATEDCKSICKRLSDAGLCEKIKYVPTEELRLKIIESKKIELKKLDPGKLFEIGGYKAISWALKSCKTWECI